MDTHVVYAHIHIHILHTNTHIHIETIAIFLLNFRGKTPLEDSAYSLIQEKAHNLERS